MSDELQNHIKPLVIRPGRWECRNGSIVTIAAVDDSEGRAWPVLGWDENGGIQAWKIDGLWLADERQHGLDLIRPADEPSAEPVLPPLTLEVGCEYETEDGRVFKVESMRPDGKVFAGWHPDGYVIVWDVHGWHVSLSTAIHSLRLTRKHVPKPPEPKMVEFWVNEYNGGFISVRYTTMKSADAWCSQGRIGRHRIVVESGKWDE